MAEKERQRKEQIEKLRQEDQETDALIFTEENRQNMEEMKQLN